MAPTSLPVVSDTLYDAAVIGAGPTGLACAIEIEKKGLKVDMPPDDLAPPDELAQALAADQRLAQAFADLTPGRRRSWTIHIAQAKKPATRVSRIKKAGPEIMAGKGWNER